MSHSQPQHRQQAEGQEEWYRVFQPEFDTVAFDPLDLPKRYHTGIYVETDRSNLDGRLFHVTGDIIAASGMRYEEKENYSAATSVHLHRYHDTQIGWVRKADYHSGRISSILRALPKPTKQQGINFWETDPVTGRHEIIWTKENGEPYGSGEQRRPIFKCNEWTNQHAVPALRSAGILRGSV